MCHDKCQSHHPREASQRKIPKIFREKTNEIPPEFQTLSKFPFSERKNS